MKFTESRLAASITSLSTVVKEWSLSTLTSR
nr:MAG TPA: hypothetical protein [Caudoviricetes sp.]